jgi:hypothetical protein
MWMWLIWPSGCGGLASLRTQGTCGPYTSQGVQNFERPWSNFFGSFYYTLNIFVSKNVSQVWPLVWRGWWVRQ